MVIFVIVLVITCVFYYHNTDINQKNINYQNNKEEIIFGDFGPYDFDDITAISVSDNNWGVIFQNQSKHHILINNENKGVFDNINGITDFKVTDNFYGFQYRIKDVKGFYVKINDEDYGPFDDNVELLFSDNYWAIKYFDKTSRHDKAIVNGENYDNYVKDIAISDNLWGVAYGIKDEGYYFNYFVIINDKKYGPYTGLPNLSIKNDSWLFHYTKEPNSSYVMFNDKEFILNLGRSYLEDCVVYDVNKWGCEYTENNSWNIIIYENGEEKTYGPYGNFLDPRTPVDFIVTKNGFIFCSNYNEAIINDGYSEKKLSGEDLSRWQNTEKYLGYLSVENQNKYFVNINEKEFGPYKHIYNFLLTDNGWGFKYLENNELIAIINNEKITNIVGGISISKNNWAVGYKKNGRLYIRIGKNEKSLSITDEGKTCGSIRDFVNYNWFVSLENAYKNKYPNDYNSYKDSGKFYNDDPYYLQISYLQHQACLSSDFFIFSPWEDVSMEGAFFTYNITEKSITKSPENSKYLARGLTEINDDSVLFRSGASSGECGFEQYGKYIFKENKIEIYKECGGCMKATFTEDDCNDVNISYQ